MSDRDTSFAPHYFVESCGHSHAWGVACSSLPAASPYGPSHPAGGAWADEHYHDGRRFILASGPSPAAGLDRDTIVQALADYEAEHGHQGWKYGDAADFIVARLSRSGGEAR